MKVDSKLTDTTLSQTKARQNALLALDVALAQLQKHAGPDARATATGESFGSAGAKYYTGVWDITGGATAKTWLVSGSESSTTNPVALLDAALDPTTEPTPNEVFLVANSTIAAIPDAPTPEERALRVRLPKVAILGEAPGIGNAVRVGSYAWWVGDQGVKASIALPDRGDEVKYAPWETDVKRGRIRQQIAGTPAYFREVTGSKEGFDPFKVNLKAVVTASQLPLLAANSRPLYTSKYHHFTNAAYSVLANTRTDDARGLLHDLSLAPRGLGTVFESIANVDSYMEAPSKFATIANADSARRRYELRGPTTGRSITGLPDLRFNVAPVLAEFLLHFKFNRTAANVVSVSSRLYVSLWNPYSSALVPPQDLQLEITGLPQVSIGSATGGTSFDLQSGLPGVIAAGSTMRVALPFTTQTTPADRASWLPGRLYGWVTPTGVPTDNKLTFYNKNLNATGWLYSTTAAVPGNSSDNNLSVSAPTVSNLKVTLRNTQGVLATYTAPRFVAVNSSRTTSSWKFAYAFRLVQPSSGNRDRTWLQTYDPRGDLVATAFRSFDPGEGEDPQPGNYQMINGNAPITAQHLQQFLIFRSFGTALSSVSSNNDVPVFELPRGAFLSLGELQHLQFVGRRPYALGNSWGTEINTVFDRFFFSGLTATGSRPDLPKGEVLPNWNLIPIDSRFNPSTVLDLNVVRDGASGQTAKYLLQGGGFNVNATSPAAWEAVLSGLRFPAAAPFVRANIDNAGAALGTQFNAGIRTTNEFFDQDLDRGTSVSSAAFFRFPQSAQETFAWNSDSAALTHAQILTTQAYRLGARGASVAVPDTKLHHLMANQLRDLSSTITALIVSWQRDRGPFRSMEEFLSPHSRFGGKSLLEEAISTSSSPINSPEISPDGVSNEMHFGFSSLTLTQADIMTALAPYLRTRSDTFVIRTYGDAINPATGETESRAWLEVIVQRLPTVVDVNDSIAKPALTGYGRRFQIISTRWLTHSEI
ncbi:MAG: hypothetical protein Q8M02_01925 [Candidatus Didemnitutus sp.]|nr:hypothetical protein [Candidatus Didemnitutus sp.]